MLSFGLYKKQLLFFALVLPLLIGGIYYFSQRYSSASVREIAPSSSTSNAYQVEIAIKANSQVLVNGVAKAKLLFIGEDHDLFRYIAADQEGVYIESIEVKLQLPPGASKEEIKANLYAVHGVGETNFFQVDEQTIVYQAYNLGPSATFTVVAQLPHGLVNFPFWQRFTYALANMNVYWWLLVSLVPFMITLFYLLLITHKTLSDWRWPKITTEYDQPPTNLSPAEVAILVEGKVSSRVIAAILLDLAQRNYLNIISKDGDFSFGKRRTIDLASIEKSPDLKSYEKILLSKIFSAKDISSGQKDILFRVAHHVFSRKVAQVYVEIYQQAAARNFFTKDPVRMYQQYRSFGLFLFFIGFLGLVAGLLLAIEPKFFLIFWLMLMMTASLIIKLAPHLPARSAKGREELLQWLSFKNFLSDKQPLSAEVSLSLLEKYLPYAIALGCEIEWAKRFANKTFIVPNWYISTKPVAYLEDFSQELFPIIGSVSRLLVLSREPII